MEGSLTHSKLLLESNTAKNLNDTFKQRISKKDLPFLIEVVSHNEDLFDEMMNIIIQNKKPFSISPSWVMGYAGIKQPQWFLKHLQSLLSSIHSHSHPSIIRNTARVFRDIEIPNKHLGTIANQCIEWLVDPKQTIAVKAFSIHALSNIINKEPGLCLEIKMNTESILPYASSGLKNAADKLLKKINQLGY